MNKVIIMISTIVLTFSGKLYAQDMLNTYQLIAAENNPALKASFSEYLAALEKIPQVGSLPDPTLAFAYFIQPVETRLGPQTAKISVNQMFPWFGTLAAREGSAEAYAKAKYEEFAEARTKLSYSVKSGYYKLYLVKKSIEISRKNIEILRTFRELALVKVEAGKTSALDLYRVEMEINDLENQLALLRDTYNALTIAFNTRLNIDSSSPIEVSDTLLSVALPDKQTELDSILMSNYSLLSLLHQIDELDYKAVSARKDGMPAIQIGLEYTFIGAGSSGVADAGKDAILFPKIGVSIPIFREKYNARIREVHYLKESRSNQMMDKENTLTILFEDSWTDLQDATRRIELYQKQLDLAGKSILLMQSAYATGQVRFEEILRMERKLLKYELELQRAVSDRAEAIAFIFYLKGKD